MKKELGIALSSLSFNTEKYVKGQEKSDILLTFFPGEKNVNMRK